MYRNRSRGVKRLASAVSNLEGTPHSDSDADNVPRAKTMPAPTEPVPKAQRKSVDSKSPGDIAGKENHKSPGSPKDTLGLRGTQGNAEKRRKLEPSQKKRTKTPPKFSLNDLSEFDSDLTLTVFPSKFEELVHKSGCTLRQGSLRHLLKKNPATFVRKLTALLSDNEDTWDQFLEGLERHVDKDTDKFHKLLLETEMDSGHEDGVATQQESLIRMMLGVECIQSRVIELLLTKLANLIQQEKERSRADNRPWVLLIIKKLCFLDQVIDPQKLQRDLFRLLEVAPTAAKQEIIYNLPYILGEKQDEELAACLINSMKAKKELTPVVLEALGHLPLGQEQSKEIQNKVLQSLKSSPVEFLPVISKFLLFNQNFILSDFDEVIDGLRTGLPFTKSGMKNLLKEPSLSSSQVRSSQAATAAPSPDEIASSKTITFHSLRQAVISNPKLLVAWLKNIKAVTVVYHHKPIDIMMLLVMHSKGTALRKTAEKVWKDRITAGMFTEDLLKETFQVLLEVVKKHVDELLDVAAFLLRSPDSQVCHFGMDMYKLAFVHFDSHLRRRVVWDLVGHVSSKDSLSKSALEVLHDLSKNNLSSMADLSICLQNLLDKVYDLDLGSVRRIMDVLCLIAYAPETSSLGGHISSLQDSINILIRKYLSSHQRQVKHLGVVAAVMAMKHIAASTGADESLDQTSDTLHSFSSIPPGRTNDAVAHFRDVLRNTSCVPEELGYSLDEMSLMVIRTAELDPKFLAYIVEGIESIFMASYLPDEAEDTSVSEAPSQKSQRGGDWEVTRQYGLDKDVAEPIVLSIGDIVIKEARHLSRGNVVVNASSEVRPLAVLGPLFRLMRIAKSRSGDDDLSGIDALLGCVVAMPAPQVYDRFEDYSVSQQGDIIDCLFHCVNWFREILNAFLQVDKEAYRPKILIRLRNIVALQRQIGRLIRHYAMYTPPMCNFHGKPAPIHLKATKPKTKKKRKGKKSKKKLDATVDEPSDEEESSEEEEAKDVEAEPKEVDVNIYRAYFRELDMNVFKVMSSDLTLVARPENGSETDPEFSPVELRLLLEDLVAKLNHALASEKRGFPVKAQPAADEGTIGFGTLNVTPSEEVASGAVDLLPVLLDKLERLREANERLLRANDGLLDGPSMFEENVKDIKVCFGLLLKAIAMTLSWSGFQRAQHNSLLTKAVKALGTRVEVPSGKRSTLVPLMEEAFNYLRNYPKSILDLKSAANFVKLVQVLSDHWERHFKRLSATLQKKNPASQVLHEVTKTFLEQKWPSLDGQPEQGLAYNHQIETLLQVYMTEAPDKMKLIGKLVPELSEDCVNLSAKDKDSCLRAFPVIGKSNVYIICGVLLKGTVEGTIARLADEKDSEKLLKIWEEAFSIMQKLVEVVRIHPTRRNQANQLKWSGELLRIFLNKGMPVLEFHLRSDQKQVMAILHSSQAVTRFNHKICCTGKVTKDNALLAHIPKVKGIMESVVYRVKSMLALHGAESAWWMGNLKNKDIDDHEVGEEDEESVTSSSIAATKSSDKKKSAKKTDKKKGKKGKASSPTKDDEEEEEEEEVQEDDAYDSDETSVSLAY